MKKIITNGKEEKVRIKTILESGKKEKKERNLHPRRK